MFKLEESSNSGSRSDFDISEKRPDNMENSKVLVVLVVIVACCSIAALVVAAVALGKVDGGTPNINVNTSPSGSSSPGGVSWVAAPGYSGGMGNNNNNKRVYTIAIAHDWGAHEYLDQEGYIQGFSKDLIAAVCQAAGIDCRTVWDKNTNCWDSEVGEHSTGGEGLMSGWYDGCMGWDTTVNRLQTFAFSTPYLPVETNYFYIKKGASFNPKDIRGKNIGFLDGWAFDEKCIARQTGIQGSQLPLAQIKHYDDVTAAVTALQSGDVDALSGDESVYGRWVQNGEMEQVGNFQCLVAGTALMTRKDNDLIAMWNVGFSKIQSDGSFKRLCNQANEQHGDKGSVVCI